MFTHIAICNNRNINNNKIIQKTRIFKKKKHIYIYPSIRTFYYERIIEKTFMLFLALQEYTI